MGFRKFCARLLLHVAEFDRRWLWGGYEMVDR